MGNMTGCPLGQGKERQEEREKITTAYLVQQWTNTIRSHLLRIYLVRARRSAVRSKFDLSKPSKKTSSKSQNAIKISKHHQNVTKIIMQNKMVQTCTSSQNKQIYKKQKKQKKTDLVLKLSRPPVAVVAEGRPSVPPPPLWSSVSRLIRSMINLISSWLGAAASTPISSPSSSSAEAVAVVVLSLIHI